MVTKMELVTIEFKIDAELYNAAEKVLAKCGYTMEDAVILFFEATIAYGRIPFDYTEKDLDEARALSARCSNDLCDV